MSMLNFKYGIHDNLKNQGIVNGTIYVTTDEKAMYVDLDNTRIRLSQIITLTTHDWQTLPPPYSAEAFYYLTDSNALLKYTGNAWVQINSTKDLREALTGLGFLGVLTAVPTSGSKGQICTVNGVNYIYSDTEKKFITFGKVGAEILDLKATVASHTTTLTTYGTDITNLKTADTEIRTALASLGQAVGYIGSGATLPQNPAVGDVFIHNGTIKVYCKESPLSEAAPAWQSLGNESYRIDVLRARIEAVAEAAGDKKVVAQLRTDLNTLQSTITDPATGLSATKDIADAAKATAIAALPKSEFNTFKTSNTQAIADAKKAGTEAQASANTANSDIAAMKKDATITTFKGLEDKIDNLTATDIAGLDDIYATDKQLSEAVAAARGKTAETVASVDAKARTNADNITKNAQDIADLRGDLEDGFKAADAMIYKGTISTGNGLPTSVEIGWTYKVTEDIKKADFSANINWATTSGNPNDDVYVRAGDLFIATGDEGTDGKITAATLEWDHIPAGYNADYVPVMTTTITNNIVNVELTSAHAADNETGDLGEFQVSAAEGSAVSVSLGAGSNIVIGMTWGTF